MANELVESARAGSPEVAEAVSRSVAVARWIAMLAMLVTIALPLPWTVLADHAPEAVSRALTSPPLFSVRPPLALPALTFRSWTSGEFQRGFEPWLAAVLEPRGWVVRLVDQLYYTVFRKSVSDTELVIGRDAHLYGLGYIRSYCEPHRPDLVAHVQRLTSALAELREALSRRGRGVVLVLSPSKAAVMPEFLPDDRCPGAVDARRDADMLVQGLRGAGLAVVDGPSLVRDMKASDPIAPFPRGGLHWSLLAGKRVGSVMLQDLGRASAADLGGFTVALPHWHAAPDPKDADLARLLNVWRTPLDFETGQAEVQCRPTEQGRRTTLIAVGGSFLSALLEPAHDCGLFEQIVHYFYYTQFRLRYPSELSPVVRAEVPWRRLLLEQSALVVELNESLIEADATHVDEFVTDALAALR